MIFTRLTAAKRGTSTLAMALALTGATALAASAIEVPAQAQKKQKGEEAPKANYSKGFVAAYSPLQEQLNAETADPATLKAAVPAILGAVETADDRFVAGQVLYQVGRKTQDAAMARQGIELMLNSGKAPADQVATLTDAAGEMAYQAQDWNAARDWFQKALAAGATGNNYQGLIAETYFKSGDNAGGLDYLQGLIDEKIASGETVEANVLARAVDVASKSGMNDRAARFAAMLVQYHPSPEYWAAAINTQRNLGRYQSRELLDLLRLSRRVDALTTQRDYGDYIEAADYRRLPQEVRDVAQEGVQAGVLTSGGNIGQIIAEADKRVAAERGDLAGLEREARSTGNLTTVTAAGDAFLNYRQPAKAEEFYARALTMSGVDSPMVLTRLGIAQVEQGKYAEAAATFAKVEGDRKPIAELWAQYARSQTAG